MKPCRVCGVAVELTAYQIRNKVYLCVPCRDAAHRAYLAVAVPAARAYVDAVNAATFCAECSAQPVEWHNPEHVELNRQTYRISNMVRSGRTVAAIRAEMARCTPLCRRCHMVVDGRMPTFVASGVAGRSVKTPKPCIDCQRPTKPVRRGRCTACDSRIRRSQRRESNVLHLIARAGGI